MFRPLLGHLQALGEMHCGIPNEIPQLLDLFSQRVWRWPNKGRNMSPWQCTMFIVYRIKCCVIDWHVVFLYDIKLRDGKDFLHKANSCIHRIHLVFWWYKTQVLFHGYRTVSSALARVQLTRFMNRWTLVLLKKREVSHKLVGHYAISGTSVKI